MQRDIQAEVILCPNCKEEVPKTLYCLNCGYPLYKVEEERMEPETPETITFEETTEQIEVEPTVEVEPEVEAVTEEVVEAPVETEVSESIEVPQIASEEEEPSEAEELTEEATLGEEEPVQAPEAEVVEEISESEVAVTTVEEAPLEEAVEEVAEMVEESEEEAEVVEEVQEEPVQEVSVEFEPDPLVTEVMENLARNISLKIRLVNLLREGKVKEATFNRLFESYSARGERWMNRRNEMLERSRYDLDGMEKSLLEARINLEELEIRKAIGDASEEEYQAKAPAFEWDIQWIGGELQRRKGEIAYLGDLTRVMSAEAAQELKEMAESCLGNLDSLVESGTVSSETATRIKATLEEALDCLKGSA